MKMNQAEYRRLISGDSRGPAAAILRLLLTLASVFYRAAVAVRNFLYDKNLLKTHRANAVVISVGNITAGGTGKTPLVIWLANRLRARNIVCAILTRGYRAGKASLSDEPAVLAEGCGGVRVMVNPDRVAGAAEDVVGCGAGVLIMDDGFQHRRLARDLDIVTIDATCPFGYGRMLPAGLLREPVKSLKRAHAAIITRSDQVDAAEMARIQDQLRRVNPNLTIVPSIHAPVCAMAVEGDDTISLEQIKGRRVFAFCAIGNPEGFVRTVRAIGADIVGRRLYDDHHDYTQQDIADICREAEDSKADLILTTQKDKTRVARLETGKPALPMAYLLVEMKFPAGQDELTGLIDRALAGKMPAYQQESNPEAATAEDL
ncbi:MAG: tetraacyldisaccharide 4'-kinase [Phycisphaerales bacterium]|nr:MAG: tetraacyldisaccharide 4'-kinase [Phycisphaerales bacterium]